MAEQREDTVHIKDQEKRAHSYWARMATLMAGKSVARCVIPEVKDEVLVAFEHGQLDRPVVIGMLWNKEDQPPETMDGEGKNDIRAISILAAATSSCSTTRRTSRRSCSSTKRAITGFSSTQQETRWRSRSQGDLTITVGGKLTITAKSGITVESSADISMKAQANMSSKRPRV